MCNEPYLSDFIAAGTAIATIVVTIIVSWYEYHLHKDRQFQAGCNTQSYPRKFLHELREVLWLLRISFFA